MKRMITLVVVLLLFCNCSKTEKTSEELRLVELRLVELRQEIKKVDKQQKTIKEVLSLQKDTTSLGVLFVIADYFREKEKKDSREEMSEVFADVGLKFQKYQMKNYVENWKLQMENQNIKVEFDLYSKTPIPNERFMIVFKRNNNINVTIKNNNIVAKKDSPESESDWKFFVKTYPVKDDSVLKKVKDIFFEKLNTETNIIKSLKKKSLECSLQRRRLQKEKEEILNKISSLQTEAL